ncbi:kinase-like domain-containing protein [Mycena sp. CBHHK59/15]|nr:kinase-like domain-containing protein [Mycena sp. CBHHK59/15]
MRRQGGPLHIVPDDMIYRRYRTVRLLGQGTFGKVVEAVDTQTDTKVAIKIIRAIPKYRDASKIEVRVLNKLKERDPLNRQRTILQPFPRQHIQSFARQLLGSVAPTHLHLIHTDLKPEISSAKRPTQSQADMHSTDIRLIDFGSATFESEYHSTVFFTGMALFQTHDNLEHLAMMEMVMGKMPERFARAGAGQSPSSSRTTHLDRARRKCAPHVPCRMLYPHDLVNRHFLNLVQKLLAFDPAQRVTVREALNHPYFSLVIANEM